MKRLFHIIIAIATLSVAVVSCSDGVRDYSRLADLPPEGWADGDTLSLTRVDT